MLRAPSTLRDSSTTKAAAAASARSVTRAVVADVGVTASTRSRGGTSSASLNGVSQWCVTCVGREGKGGGVDDVSPAAAEAETEAEG